MREGQDTREVREESVEVKQGSLLAISSRMGSPIGKVSMLKDHFCCNVENHPQVGSVHG